MNVTFACPFCNEASRVELAPDARELPCKHCHRVIEIPADAYSQGQVHRCLACPSRDLFVRKDFPQRLGVGIVAVGLLGSSIAWAGYHVYLTFFILFATALVDVLLYMLVGDSLMCYRCSAQYRGVEGLADHGHFDLETHEKHRQDKARLEKLGAPRGAGSSLGK